MRKKENKNVKLVAVAILFLFIGAIVVQADVKAATNTPFKWEDNFLDTSKIETTMSSNIKVVDGKVIMDNTYKAWHYMWPKMIEINIQNSGSAQPEYVLPLRVYKTTGMQSDFSDLRFVNVDGNSVYDLEYWVGEYNSNYADAWVRVSPEVPSGSSKIYMFYGDDNAPDLSNFNTMFKWDDRTSPDIMISYKATSEGAWDPDVEWGGGRFLVAWEERQGPQRINIPVEGTERTLPSVIHGRTYNYDGGDPQPIPSSNTDIDISLPDNNLYHAENPAIASDGSKFLVVWEENPAWSPLHRYDSDIMGAIVSTSGSVTRLTDPISAAINMQCDASVAYGGGKFLVVWEDARAGASNYDVWGRFYTSSGSPSGNEFQITSGANYEGEPWVCYGNGFFLVVYESGDNPVNGPFSINAKKLGSTGATIWTKTLATGSSGVDNNFPADCYNPINNQYLVTWNTGDISSNNWHGSILGNILNQDGSSASSGTITIQSGNGYVRSDCAAYLNNMYFTAYDKGDEDWGKLVYTNTIMSNEQALSDGSSESLDWNSLAVSDNSRVFVVWEDDRDQASQYSDVFGSVWHIYKSTGSTLITYTFGSEKSLIKDATLVSKVIPSQSVQKWQEFYATYNNNIGDIYFYVLDKNGAQIHSDLGDISNIPVQDIRLKAKFTRNVAADSPYIDLWGVSYLGADITPPWTEIYLDPETPNGNNGWYKGVVDVELRGFDDTTGVKAIHYKTDGGSEQTSTSNPCDFTIRESGSHSVEYWSVDNAGNIETHKTKSGIKIDGRNPKVSILKPDQSEMDAGPIDIEATVTEQESGIAEVGIYLNNDPNPMKMWTSAQDKYTYTFTAGPGETYDIEVKASDKAGNMGNAYMTIHTRPGGGTSSYSPQIGYLYTVNGASEHILLHILGLSLVITNKLNIWIKPDSSVGTVDHVKFDINGKKLDAYGSGDGYFRCEYDPPTGIYRITAAYYNSEDHELGTYSWPGKVFFINAL